jgi:DNA polymerase-3 subunit delta
MAAGRRADHRDGRRILAKRSSLRKLFEGSKTAQTAAIYDDPPGRGEIEELLKTAGIVDSDRAAMVDLETLARTLSAGDFRQTIDKLGLYKRGDATPVSPAGPRSRRAAQPGGGA